MLYGLYSALGTVFHALLVVPAPLLQRLKPEWRLDERFGRYTLAAAERRDALIWIHAASVGEIQAARVLINALRSDGDSHGFFVTTMTAQGRAVARSLLPADVRCELAPLDTNPAVARSLQNVAPDLYICLETELWPVMLTRLRRAGIPMLLLNGRMSARSCRRYGKIRKTMAALLAGFAAVAVISEEDAVCYRMLGVADEKIRVCGNMKFAPLQEHPNRAEEQYRRLLNARGKTVFLCGSTRGGEEKLLLPVYKRLQEACDGTLLWLIAPRHLERLDEIRAMLDKAGLRYDMLSRCRQGQARREKIVLVDTMGELAGLYTIGDLNFCGGSLVNKGGHNIMEPVLQGRPVYFGPHMDDFQDAVQLVLTAGAGFQVDDADKLAKRTLEHLHDSEVFSRARQAAARLARTRHEAVQCQLELVHAQLASGRAAKS